MQGNMGPWTRLDQHNMTVISPWWVKEEKAVDVISMYMVFMNEDACKSHKHSCTGTLAKRWYMAPLTSLIDGSSVISFLNSLLRSVFASQATRGGLKKSSLINAKSHHWPHCTTSDRESLQFVKELEWDGAAANFSDCWKSILMQLGRLWGPNCI